MANKTISIAVGKGKKLTTASAPMPRKMKNTPSVGHHAGTNRSPGYC